MKKTNNTIMTNRELKLKLKNLRTVKSAVSPNALWLAETRRSIVGTAKLSGDGVQLVAPIVMPRNGWQKAFVVMSPILASFMAIGLGIMGWAAGVSSTIGTGSFIRSAAERTQLTFAADASSRAYLHMELAGRRANELAVLVEANSQDQKQVLAAVNDLRNEIDTIGANLDEVKTAQSSDTSAVAKAVDRKVAEIQAVMSKTKRLLSANAKAQATALELAADDVSIKAVAVLAAGAKSEDEKTDAATRVGDKIAALENNIQVASTEASEQAKAILKQAKEALAKDNLAEAVTKVQLGTDLVNGAAKAGETEIEENPKASVDVNVNANANVNVNAAAGTVSDQKGKIKAIGF
jgi:hypothetical protein